MKVKVAELEGPALNWAVAKCEGIESLNSSYTHGRGFCIRGGDRYAPSSAWSQGGPIIEREGISIGKADEPDWWAFRGWKAENGTPGPTPLVAAMRCFVASKLGPEIEVPDELMAYSNREADASRDQANALRPRSRA